MSGSPIHFEVLPSGPALLVRELRVAPVAEVQVWAQVGSADERGPAEAGLAHFFEHMLFKGTPVAASAKWRARWRASAAASTPTRPST